ncbi:MAG: hypothetical protein HY246_07880 [Proteobacteria bacterium]|nr:hypothetical protein [Pseudomonadota bacterium]
MSRLDSFVRRLEAQRACLDFGARAVRNVPGHVLELGLGNGRTYDHLRELVGESREIFAFDRQLTAHPACIPDPAHFVQGELSDTLPRFGRTHPRAAALVHADTGTGDLEATRALAAWLGPALVPVLAAGAVIMSDQPLAVPGCTAVALPAGVAHGRYFLYRSPRM